MNPPVYEYSSWLVNKSQSMWVVLKFVFWLVVVSIFFLYVYFKEN